MSLELGKRATHFGARLRMPAHGGNSKRTGNRTFVTLREAPVQGRRPPTLAEKGDEVFEGSRIRAQYIHDDLQKKLSGLKNQTEILRLLYVAETGREPPRLTLQDLPSAYISLERTRKLAPRYASQVLARLNEFAAFVAEQHPGVSHLAAVDHEMVREFLRMIDGKGLAEKTYNDYVKLLEGAFRRLRRQASLIDNPVEGIPHKEETVVHRKPFSVEELERIISCCLTDEFVGPIIITMMCTALRRGRACLIDWSQVNLTNGFVSITKPGKKGGPVDIPIFPLLRGVLAKAGPKPAGPVFPGQAEMYLKNPDGITWRVQQVLIRAGFDASVVDDRDNDLSVQHPTGQRRASIRGSHSFRVTWITLALASGVPVDVVKKITGHKIVETVLIYYFQPGRHQLRDILLAKLPQLLVGAQNAASSPHAICAKIRLVVDCMRPDNVVSLQPELLQLLDDLMKCLPTIRSEAA